MEDIKDYNNRGNQTVSTLKSSLLLLLTSTMIGTSIFGAPLAVSAEGTTVVKDAMISGDDTPGNNSSVRDTTCGGAAQLSGLDATVFESVPSEGLDSSANDSQIICAKSTGFSTEVENADAIKNYHWISWYKNNKDDEVDKSQEEGNYAGFPKDKVDDWREYQEDIKKLNNDQFPEDKDYKYPADTKEGKLDFWADVAGYYDILGDPQYEGITVKSKQHFTYTVQNTYIEEEIVDKDDLTPAEKEALQASTSSGGGGTGLGPEEGKKEEWSGLNNLESLIAAVAVGVGGQLVKGIQQKVLYKSIASAMATYVGAGAIATTASVAAGLLAVVSVVNTVVNYQEYKKTPQGQEDSFGHSLGVALVGKEFFTILDVKENPDDEDSVIRTTTTIEMSEHKKTVPVAEAVVAKNSYATEIASFEKIALVEGAADTLEYNRPLKGFWEKAPKYWENDGKQIIENKNMFYHYDSVEKVGEGQNTINIYADMGTTDKLYSVIHGFTNITQVSGYDKDHYPKSTATTCVKAQDKKTCSKKQTPLINIPLDISKEQAQTQEEVDKIIHHSNNQLEEEKQLETNNESKPSKKPSNNNEVNNFIDNIKNSQ